MPGIMLPVGMGGDGDGFESPCLSDDEVVAFLEDRLDDARRAQIEQHLDVCQSCFESVAAMVRASLLNSRRAFLDTLPLARSGEMLPELRTGPLEPGQSIGRYRIVDRLGQGAMGVVYRAFDPMLERDVALKLIRSDRPSAGLRMQALKEGQALARLNHTNAITVYDLGFGGEQVFVAMELIEGETIASWLRRERRGWRAIRDVFVQAARGLAAAHAAGLIHRDFKPENALISAADGRVVVTDFGLVCLLDVSGASTNATLDLAGTPAYMAPEQFTGSAIDERTDVFNFCAAMYESLFGQAAFVGNSLAERREAVCLGRFRRLPAQPRAPRWIRNVLIWGLQADPQARPRSMDLVVAALEHDRRVRRRVLVGSVAGAVVALAATCSALMSYLSPLHACHRRAGVMQRLWSAPAKARVRASFKASGLPFAPVVAQTVAEILDRFDDDWSRGHRATCDAAYRDGAESREGFELRIDCLDARRVELAKLIDLLQNANATVVNRAVAAASDLGAVSECGDSLALRATPLPPQIARSALVDIRRQLAEAHSFELVGAFTQAEARVGAALRAAQKLGYAPLEADAWLREGYVLRDSGKWGPSEAAFKSAFDLAERGGADRERMRAATQLIDVVGHRQGQLEANRWAEQAEAILVRLGMPDLDRAALLAMRGLLRKSEGRLAEAETDLRAAYELRRKVLASDNPLIAQTLLDLGRVLDEHGEYERARALYEQARRELLRLLGR